MIPRALVTILTTHEKYLGALTISIDCSEMGQRHLFKGPSDTHAVWVNNHSPREKQANVHNQVAILPNTNLTSILSTLSFIFRLHHCRF